MLLDTGDESCLEFEAAEGLEGDAFVAFAKGEDGADGDEALAWVNLNGLRLTPEGVDAIMPTGPRSTGSSMLL